MFVALLLLLGCLNINSCRNEIHNYPSKNAMKDALREKFTSAVKGYHKGSLPQ